MSTPNAHGGETLEHLVARFLRTVPETWTEYDVSALSELEERALFLLTGAGMIERRTSLRLQMFGHPVAVEATITLTGECGFAGAMEYVSARMWDEWREVFEKRKASDQKDAPAFHCERIGKEQWRLTAEGGVARNDLTTDQSSTVFDFVLNRGFFAARPLVQGQGKLEKMTTVNPNAGPTGVSIANWEDGGKAFAAAFAGLVKSHATNPAPDVPGPPPNGTQLPEGSETLAALLRIVSNGISDDRIKQVMKIINGTNMTVNEKLAEIDSLIPTLRNTSAEKLAGLLGVRRQAVHKTEWWEKNRKGAKKRDSDMRRAALRERANHIE